VSENGVKTRDLQYRRCEGKADPFGLLVLVVLLAVSLTIAVQAQVSSGQRDTLFEPTVVPLAILN
jgi:hypothetical protein